MRRYLLTGGRGFIGKHLAVALARRSPGGDVVAVGREYDLTERDRVAALFQDFGRFDYVVHLADLHGNAAAAAANAAAQFRTNATMALNVLEAWHRYQPQSRLVGFSSLWAYPEAITDASEQTYWDGRLHPSIEHYGVIKKFLGSGIEAHKRQHQLRGTMLVLGSVYGPGDASFHVIPSLIRRMQANPEAVEIWGDGTETRDFIYIDDAVEGIIRHLDFDGPLLNIGSGISYRISDVVETLARAMSYGGKITYNPGKGMGVANRSINVSLARRVSGWPENCQLQTLADGLRKTIQSITKPNNV